MGTERIDLGEMLIAKNDDLMPEHVLFGRPDAVTPSTRFIKAFARGEVTEGGMAEAGWFVVGKLKS